MRPSASCVSDGALQGINPGIFDRIHRLPMPVIGLVEGYALGGGAELAYACDFRIGVPTTKIGHPEVGLGILAAAGATWRRNCRHTAPNPWTRPHGTPKFEDAMPDRFDLSNSADLSASLQLATRFCQVADIASLSVVQRHRLRSARTYLTEQREVVDQWLAGSLRSLGANAILPQPAPRPFETTQELLDLGGLISELTPKALSLASRKDTVYAVAPYDGQIMGRDFAKHLVRVICACTIDLGWSYPE